MKSIILMSVFIISMLVQPVFATNENLYVSSDIAEQGIVEKYYSQLENTFPFSDGCTSFAPENYHHKSNYFYIDELSPTFDVGFFKNEHPLVIDSTPFTKSDFLKKSKTVTVETGNPIVLKVLLFENRGPQNIQNVILYINLQDSFSIDDNTPYISLNKDPPGPVSDPIHLYIKGQIEEDFGQSYRYGTPWASYSVKTHDPNGLFGNVTSSFSKENHKLETVFEFSFQNPMPKSNLVLTSSDVNGNTMTCYILDAIEVNGYYLDRDDNLPHWFENNFQWYKEGMISETELINAIKYLEAKSSFVEIADKCYREKFPIDWSGCNLYGKVLPNIDFRYANLSNANLAGAIFSGKDLSNANLSGAFLKYAEIDNANLTNADLSSVNIVRGWVRGSDLSNANLSGAYLWNTDFTSSNLTNVNFQDATLTYAILAGTDLKDANLDGAGTWSTNLNDCYNHPICE